MRIVKKAEERKREILDAAEDLFGSKGFEKTTINDILAAVNIGKGTFYYHYTSKEEVLDAIIERRCDRGVRAAELVAGDASLTVLEKLLGAMQAQKPGNEREEKLVSTLHEASNALMHQKSLTQTVISLSPVLARIIEQGNAEGSFTAPYPREAAESLLVIAMTIFDEGYFSWTREESSRKATAFLSHLERILGAPEGCFSLLVSLF